MPVVPFTDGRIYIAGVNLSAHANTGMLELTAAELDASSISDAWDVFVMGRKKARLEASGHWEAGSGLPDDLFALLGSANQPVTVLPDGDEGGIGYAFRAVPVAYSQSGTAGELVQFSTTATGDVARAVRGTIVADDTAAITSTSDGTAFELGAVSASQTVYAAMHVLAVSGTNPTLDVIIESDTEEAFGDTPATQLTFSEFSAIGAEWQSAAGANTDTWWRAGFTIGGTDSPSFTVAIVVAIH